MLSVDYLTEPARIDDYYARAARRGYVPFAAASRALDQTTLVAGHVPD